MNILPQEFDIDFLKKSDTKFYIVKNQGFMKCIIFEMMSNGNNRKVISGYAKN